jgi:hypothetical protein
VFAIPKCFDIYTVEYTNVSVYNTTPAKHKIDIDYLVHKKNV